MSNAIESTETWYVAAAHCFGLSPSKRGKR